MRCLLFACAVALFMVAGCSAQRAPLMTLKPAPDFDVTYAGSVGDTGQWPAIPEFDGKARSERQVFLSARVMRLSAEVAHELVGDAGTVGVCGISLAQMDQLVLAARARGAQQVTGPTMVVLDGQRAHIQVGGQTAYVSGFELREQGRARVADPVIRSLATGLMLVVRPELAEAGAVRLQLEMQLAEVVRPVARSTIMVFGSPMSIETPTVLTQQLSGSGVIVSGQGLLFTGLVGQGSDVLLVMLTGAEYAPQVPKEGVDVMPDLRPRKLDEPEPK